MESGRIPGGPANSHSYASESGNGPEVAGPTAQRTRPSAPGPLSGLSRRLPGPADMERLVPVDGGRLLPGPDEMLSTGPFVYAGQHHHQAIGYAPAPAYHAPATSAPSSEAQSVAPRPIEVVYLGAERLARTSRPYRPDAHYVDRNAYTEGGKLKPEKLAEIRQLDNDNPGASYAEIARLAQVPSSAVRSVLLREGRGHGSRQP